MIGTPDAPDNRRLIRMHIFGAFRRSPKLLLAPPDVLT